MIELDDGLVGVILVLSLHVTVLVVTIGGVVLVHAVTVHILLAICLIAHYRESRTLVGTTYVVLLAAESGKANLMVLADALGEVEEVVVVVVGCVLYISVAPTCVSRGMSWPSRSS